MVAGCVTAAAVVGFATATSTRFAAVAGLAAVVTGLALVSGLATLTGSFAPPAAGFDPSTIGFAPLSAGLFALVGAPGAQALGAAGAAVEVLGSDCFCCCGGGGGGGGGSSDTGLPPRFLRDWSSA